MKDNAPESIKVSYYSHCIRSGRLQTKKCYGLHVGDVVVFETEIVVKSCPEDPKDRNQVFQIYAVGASEALIVNLEMICSCECETT